MQRACHLVILAEIITRWPALQPRLHQKVDGRTILYHLAAGADDDIQWKQALDRAAYDMELHERALANLRELLRGYDGEAVAHLAALVL